MAMVTRWSAVLGFDATLYAMIPFSLRRLFIVFLRVGNLTFGGGDPTMAALHQELVVSRGWLAADRYSLIYSLARATPGTNVLAFCAGVGWQLARWRGALLTLMAASIPCSALVVWFTYAYGVWRTSPLAMAAIGGMLAAAAGMTAAAGWQLVRPHWKPGRRFRAAVIASGAFALAYWFSFSPIAILALGALSGLAWRTPS